MKKLWKPIRYAGYALVCWAVWMIAACDLSPKPQPKDDNAVLRSLELAGLALSPEFNPNVTNYTSYAAYTQESVVVTAAAASGTASVAVNGSSASEKVLLTEAVSTLVSVHVTAESGRKKSYAIAITRAQTPNLDLKTLVCENLPLTPRFSPSIREYTLSTAFAKDKLRIQAEPEAASTTVLVNDSAPPADIALAPGTTTITVALKAKDGTEGSYVIKVTRADTDVFDLKSLTVDGLTTVPAFDQSIRAYRCGLVHGRASVTITAEAASTASSVSINGMPSPHTLTLHDGLNQVNVTVQSGVQEKNYTLALTRAAETVTLRRGMLNGCYAAMIENAFPELSADSVNLNIEGTTIQTCEWYRGHSVAGAPIKTGKTLPSATLQPELNNTINGICNLALKITDTAGCVGVYYYEIPVMTYSATKPRPDTLLLPPIKNGYGVVFDFLPDGRLLVLAGSFVYEQKEIQSNEYETRCSVDDADPAFISLSRDGSYALIGVGLGGDSEYAYNGFIWKLDLATWKKTKIAEVKHHFAMAWWDDTTILLRAGTPDDTESYIYAVNLENGEAKKLITLPECPLRGGLCADDDGSVYVGVRRMGTSVGIVKRFTKEQITGAMGGSALTLDDGALILQKKDYTMYSLVCDGNGALFADGEWTNVSPPVCAYIDRAPYHDNELMNFSSMRALYKEGVRSRDGKYIGWVCQTGQTRYCPFIMPVK